ncbi:hypothetical protein [Agrobacterium sp. CG674]
MSAKDDALKTFSDFDIQWTLLTNFIEVRTEWNDDIAYQQILVRTPFTHDQVPAPDIPHRAECTATGLKFNVTYHSLAGMVEVSQDNGDWQWFLEAFVKEAEEADFDEEDTLTVNDIAVLAIASTFAVKGDINKFANYAMLLKLSGIKPYDYCGLDFTSTKTLPKYGYAVDDADLFEQ